ncbi:MAG: chitobiase/beta-hexosaminidase C-terminal domain-containing protein [Armatimonadetes bacterium]|nr:chitobiase/beta-hexosaminidase C-terminal domain-containing protein [Armatimonadota bacterium]
MKSIRSVLMVAVSLLAFSVSAGQATTWDLATDWTISTATGNARFGPDNAWTILHANGTTIFDIERSFTSASPWIDGANSLYNIDGWACTGYGSPPYKPMAGKNIGGGNIPGWVGATYYDWPEDRIAAVTHPTSWAANITVAWYAPKPMNVSISGGVWTAGRYSDITARRTRVSLFIDYVSNGYGGADYSFFGHRKVPLWYDADGNGIIADSTDPWTFAESTGGSDLQNVQVATGDRIICYFYWNNDPPNVATGPGLNGLDLTITEVLPTVPTPTFFPDGGTYSEPQNVTISCASPGATIYFTTDGSDPSETNGTVYSGPVLVDRDLTLKARAYESGYSPSMLKWAEYRMAPVATPTFSPDGGMYATTQLVTIECVTPGAAVRYTSDGSDPIESSTEYIAPLVVDHSLTLKARAYKPGYGPSDIKSAQYTVDAMNTIWDLAADWTNSTPTGTAVFGADNAWAGVWGGVPNDFYDAGVSFTSGSPWYDPAGDTSLYNINAWANSEHAPAYLHSFVGKNTGGGVIPDSTYDWPVGKIVGWTPVQKYRSQPYFHWEAPADGTAAMSGGVWAAGRYADMTHRRNWVTIGFDVASNGYQPWGGDPLGWARGKQVPLWTQGYTSSNPYTFANIMGADSAQLSNINIKKGDRLFLYFYEEDDYFEGCLSGLDFHVDYSANLAAPTFFPAGGLYIGQQNVVIYSATPGATVRYTTDGSDPVETSAQYTSPIPVDHDMTIKARAFMTGSTPSQIVRADYVVVGQPQSGAIGEMKGWADDTVVQCDSVIVTADSFPNSFYVQSADRSSGIRVDGGPTQLSVGKRASIIGIIKTDAATAERFIDPVSVNITGAATDFEPVGMNNRSLGGAGGGAQQGVTGGTGLNNIGLLVKVWGTATRDPVNTSRFKITDGTGADVTVETPGGVMRPLDSVYVSVTGISSCEKVGSEIRCLLKVRDSGDIHYYNAAPGASETVFYVATNGSDSWSGRLDAPNAENTDGPFATLARAQNAVRAFKQAQGGLDAPVKVMVRGGKYFLSQTLVLSEQDSGVQGFPVTWCAYPGEAPIIIGGKKITGWTTYQGSIMQATAPGASGGAWKFRQLFMDGQLQIRSRTPNYNSANPLYGGWSWMGGLSGTDGFIYSSGLFSQQLAKPTQAEVYFMCGPAGGWGSDITSIKSIDYNNRIIHTTCPYASDPLIGFNSSLRFRVENALELVDQAGEWCLDWDTGKVYFWPPTPINGTSEVIAPSLNNLIILQGAKSIKISGFTFIENQWGEQVRLDSTYDVQIQSNRFLYSGGYGLKIMAPEGGDCSKNLVSHNEFAYTQDAGIFCEGHVSFNQISDNEVHHCAVFNKYASGIGFMPSGVYTGSVTPNSFSNGNVVAHNYVHDLPREGINLGANPYGSNIVEYNKVNRVCLETIDTSGIRCHLDGIAGLADDLSKIPPMVGHVFRYNSVMDAVGCGATNGQILTPYYGDGAYFDDLSANILLYGNIIVRSPVGFWSNAGKNIHIENNIFVDCQDQIAFGIPPHLEDPNVYAYIGGHQIVRNIIYGTSTSNLSTFPVRFASSYFNSDAAKKSTVTLSDYNLFFRTDSNYSTLNTWRALGYDSHSLTANPLFVDMANDDYRLQLGSPALSLGFVPIDVSQIGIRN